MPIEAKFEKVSDPADPRRCQGIIPNGQCQYIASEGSRYCHMHGGNKSKIAEERKKVHDYRLQKWQEKIDHFSASELCTSLRGEVGVLRMMLEETLEMCQNPQDLHLYSSRIQDIVMKIDKVVNSVSKIDSKSGNLLDKSGALILAGQIVEIISKYVTDPKQIDEISDALIELVTKMAGKSIEEDLDGLD